MEVKNQGVVYYYSQLDDEKTATSSPWDHFPLTITNEEPHEGILKKSSWGHQWCVNRRAINSSAMIHILHTSQRSPEALASINLNKDRSSGDFMVESPLAPFIPE